MLNDYQLYGIKIRCGQVFCDWVRIVLDNPVTPYRTAPRLVHLFFFVNPLSPDVVPGAHHSKE